MIFDRLSNTNLQIDRINEKIEYLEMQISTPRSGEITGMPKDGSSQTNPFDRFLEKKEELDEKLARLNEKKEQQWSEAQNLMLSAGVSKQNRYLIYLRFYKGLKWKKCSSIIHKKYPDSKWNINKCFREYRNVMMRVRRS